MLVGNTVTSSAEVRRSSVIVKRSYTFEKDHIVCDVALDTASADEVFSIWGGRPWFRGKVIECYEMIPFVDVRRGRAKPPAPGTTELTAVGGDGKAIGTVADKAVKASAVIIALKGGYGAVIEFERPQTVLRGQNDTLLVQLADKLTPANEIALRYKIVPFIGTPSAGLKAAEVKPETIASVGPIATPDKVAAALADAKAYEIKEGRKVVAQVRFAVAGDKLAFHAVVTAPKVKRDPVPWKTSCIEIFGSMPGTKKIGQILLAPALGDTPAGAWRGGANLPFEPKVAVTSKLTRTGYELDALIPIEFLAVDPAQGKFTLEVQVDLPVNAAARKYAHPTLFGSRLAYMDSFRYGTFVIEKK